MKARTTLLLLTALLLLGARTGRAQEAPAGDATGPDDDGPLLGRLEQFDASFTFVKPGETTVAQSLHRLGAPAVDYPAWVTAGKMDWEIAAQTPDSLDHLPKPHEEVRVLEWYDARDESRPAAKLVFRRDVLWYALVPLTASESTPAKLEERYGRKPSNFVEGRLDADVGHSLTVYGYPDLGIAYVRDSSDDVDGVPSFRTKAIFPPVKK